MKICEARKKAIEAYEHASEYPYSTIALNAAIDAYATICANQEREKIAAWMIYNGYATGHGDTIEDLLLELKGEIIKKERKACAEIAKRDADDFYTRWPNPTPDERIVIKVARDIENAIRARKS